MEDRRAVGWASADARGLTSGLPSVHAFVVPPEAGVTAAIISSFDSAVLGPDDRSEHHVSIFWEFQQTLCVSHLLYPANDPKGPDFEKVLEDNASASGGQPGGIPSSQGHQTRSNPEATHPKDFRARNPPPWCMGRPYLTPTLTTKMGIHSR